MTTPITERDLRYRYSKTAIHPDDPRRTGIPDSTLLNRGELYEMLEFLNRFVRSTRYRDGRPFDKADALKAERLIHTLLPINVRSHANVTKWLIDNWNAG